MRVVRRHPFRLCRLGDALLRQNKVDEATEVLQRALAASPDYGEAHSRLGIAYFLQGRYAEAREHFARHVELRPDDANALTNLADVLTRFGEHAEAVELLQRALRADPQFGPAHDLLWRTLTSMGRRREALSALRSAHRALPEDPVITHHLAGLLTSGPRASAADGAEALRLLESCCPPDSTDPEHFYALSEAHAAAGDFAKAAETARRALHLAEQQGNAELAKRIANRLMSYQSRRP